MSKEERKQPSLHESALRKRATIVRQARVLEEPQDFDEALAQLNSYLDRCHKKHTQERTLILHKLHCLTAPVDIETLHQLLDDENSRVSIATVYNTMQLFCEAQLVSKIELIEGGMAFYERTVGMQPRIHIVCKKCGCISTLMRPGLVDELQHACPKGFKVAQLAFNIYGYCHRCQNTMNRAELRKRTKSTRGKKKSESEPSATPKAKS